MGLNDRVSAERIHIGFFGLRNAGKSSVVNAVTGQKLSLVSEVKGTTTDPVQKAMELLPARSRGYHRHSRNRRRRKARRNAGYACKTGTE